MEHFDYAGVLTIEFFLKKGKLIANETAPRVHNSGHWTIEGAVTGQFENHMRAILGLPLGDTWAMGYSAMINFIGTMPPLEAGACRPRRPLPRLWQGSRGPAANWVTPRWCARLVKN